MPSISKWITLAGFALAACAQSSAPAAADSRSQPRGASKAASSTSQAYTKPPDSVLRKRLSAIEYRVTQKNGTEPAFHNRYWDNKAVGLYVDVVTGEPLFLSTDKFKSGTGWPSFTRPIERGRITLKTDTSYGMTRTEVRSKIGDSHLGHVFDDGPKPTGMRYCINSAALRFIPLSQLEAKGYGTYRKRLRAAQPK